MSGINNFHFSGKISFWIFGSGDMVIDEKREISQMRRINEKKIFNVLGSTKSFCKKETGGGEILFFVGKYMPLQVYCSYGRLTIVLRRGVYYPHNWYFFPPPFFQNDIFSPSTVKIYSFPLFPHLLPLIFACFLNKSSYFFPNQPITHILNPWFYGI